MKIDKAIRTLASAAGIGFVEFLVVGKYAPLKMIFKKTNKKKLRLLEPHFDRECYLRQIRSIPRRTRASDEPLLHYLLVGWRETRSPNARFDPVFIGYDMQAIGASGEPLLNFLARANWGTFAQNEIEASRGRIASRGPRREAALIFHHGRGGGSSKFLDLFEHALQAKGVETLRLRPLPKSDRLFSWPSDDPEVFDLLDEGPRVLEKARDASVKMVVVSHVIDYDASAIFDFIETLVAQLGAQLCVILHDYFYVCPRVNLVDYRGRCCSIPDTKVCVECVSSGGGEIGGADPVGWRDRCLAFLAGADRIIAPSNDLRDRMAGFMTAPMEVWRPENDALYPQPLLPALRVEQKLSVAVLGSLNTAKGSQVVLELARCIARSRAPIVIDIHGDTDISGALRREGVFVRGRYRDRDLAALLHSAAPHIVLMPAIWPETWSFVLTTALECGLHVMAFAHGAQYERLEQLGRGDLLLPVAWIDRPDRILAALLAFRTKCLQNAPPHGEEPLRLTNRQSA